jgi:hypothetical protein
VFDKAVGEILSNEFAQQFRNFLDHPEAEDAVLTTEVCNQCIVYKKKKIKQLYLD